jgi:hypothetical protein
LDEKVGVDEEDEDEDEGRRGTMMMLKREINKNRREIYR